ncbi:MAG: SMP-30/gluconolactonase/LRE family protein [Verrucomicrobia bacterium]|nr:SMP-30/gluconolactonase/LRE family protein [Verrucomicrobiota bacterium]
MRTMTRVASLMAVLGLCWFLGGCGCECECGKAGLMKPRVGFMLPEKYNSPDGMTLGKDGCIYLAMNNVVLQQHPAKILRITPDDQLEEVITLPPQPDTKLASPLGVAFGSDGNLYVADCQAFCTKEPAKSRLLRVNMKDGKATGCDVVAVGLNMANGVAAKGDCIYVCDTTLNKETPMASGVYRFAIAELDAKNPLKVTGLGDPRLVVKLSTQNKEHPVGANGLDFDAAGNMYVCNFGDREVIKVVFDAAGKVQSQAVLAKDNGMESTDGLHCDAAGNLWVADFLGNAVVRIDSKSGAVTVVAKNGESDGADGSLHSPSECIVRGNKLYVSNINLAYGPHKSSKLYTISVIDLK